MKKDTAISKGKFSVLVFEHVVVTLIRMFLVIHEIGLDGIAKFLELLIRVHHKRFLLLSVGDLQPYGYFAAVPTFKSNLLWMLSDLCKSL